MRKKVLNVMLFSALLAAGTASVTSCKDYDEDNYAGIQYQFDENDAAHEVLQKRIANLEDSITKHRQNLNELYNLLKQNQADAAEDKKELEDKIIEVQQQAAQELEQKIQALETEYNNAINNIVSTYKLGELWNKIDELENTLAGQKCECADKWGNYYTKDETYNRTEIEQKIADAVANLATKQDVEDAKNELAAQIAALETKHKEDSTTLATAINLKANQADLDDLEKRVKANEETLKDLKDDYEKYKEEVAQKLAEKLDATVFEAAQTIINNRLEALESAIQTKADKSYVDDKVKELNDAINDLKDLVDTKADKTVVDQIKSDLEAAQQAIIDLQNNKADKVALEALEERVKAAEDKLADLEPRVSALETKVGELEKAIEAAKKELQDQIDDLTTRVEKLETDMKVVQETLLEIIDDLIGITNALDKLITEITVNGSYNPVYGTFNTPFGVNSNVLATYYGYSDSDIQFPSKDGAKYVFEEDALSVGDINRLGVTPENIPAGLIFDETTGNAGKLYVTINPSGADFEDVKFKLVNSQNAQAPVTLGLTQVSEDVLKFGYTRADANATGVANGFYEIPATIEKSQIAAATPKIDKNDLIEIKNELVDKIKNNDAINLTNVAGLIYENLKPLDAYAVQTTFERYSDEDLQNVTSDYKVAATALKPLSYASFKDLKGDRFFLVNRAEKILDDIVEQFNEAINIDFSHLTVTKVGKKHIDKEFIYTDVEVKVILPKDTKIETNTEIKNAENQVIGTITEIITTKPVDTGYQEATVKVDVRDFVVDIDAAINEMVDEFNNQLDNVNEIMKEVQQLTKITDAFNDTKDRFTSYLEKANKLYSKGVQSANKALQPVLLVHSTNGYSKLSRSYTHPSRLTGGNTLNLIATSNTADIVAPAYKKLVGVTNVYEKGTKNAVANSASLIQQANTGIRIMKGSERYATISNLQSGYTYEIAYTAVDYSGKVVARKYYVTVE